MSPIRDLMIDGYTALTWPWRQRLERRYRRVAMSPISVVYYHRVADHHLNSWTITQADFRRHLDWMQSRFDLISLAETQRRIEACYNPRPAIAITFDDGYAENCDFAIPLLLERQIPVTYFCTVGNIQSGQPFPHDVKAGTPAPVNTPHELFDMAAAGVEIGGHTRTHADLGPIRDEGRLQDEVLGACLDLAEIIERPVRYFAFPFGMRKNLNDRVFRLCREAGLAGVCSAYGGYNLPGDDAFHIQRFHADPQLSRLRNWLTLDPRKFYLTPRYEPKLTTNMWNSTGEIAEEVSA